jgi:peptide/nickel transport system substrate-binding protein
VQVLSTLVDPQISNLNYFWSKGISKGRFQTNATDYRNAEMDEAIEVARTAIDPERRRVAMYEFQRLAVRDLPLIPLVEYESYNIFNKKVQGHSDGPMWPLQSWAGVWLNA